MSWHVETADALPPLVGVDCPAVALGMMEARLPPTYPPTPEGPIRVLAWRCDMPTAAAEAARLLGASGSSLAFLAMQEAVPPSGAMDAIGAVARRLGAGHVAAMLGTEAVDAWCIAVETVGMISPQVMFKLGLERLPLMPGSARAGSPCAVLGQFAIDQVDVTFASVALEPSDGPDVRARQMAMLLDRIDAYGRWLPVLIGGDMATTTFTPEELADAGRMRLVLHSAAQRLLLPVAHEPMFHLLRQRGYEWRPANLPLTPTGRSGPPGADRDQLYKRLWFFARGLICDEPAVVPAMDTAGQPMGSHDAIALRIRPA